MSKGTESGRVVRMWRLTYDGQHVWLTEPFSLSMLADHLPAGHSITIEAADLNPAEAESAAQQSLARLEAAAQGGGVARLWGFHARSGLMANLKAISAGALDEPGMWPDLTGEIEPPDAAA